MKIKVKSKEELLFQNKISFEVFDVPEKGAILSQQIMNDKVEKIAGKELSVKLHKFSKECNDDLGYAYELEVDGMPEHYMFILPYEVEKILEYDN